MVRTERLGEDAQEVLRVLAVAAGDQPEALRTSIRAAAAADAVHAHGESAALLERALELWQRVPNPEALAGADHVSVLARAADAHAWTGERPRAEVLLRAALGELDEDAEPRRAATLLRSLAGAQWSL